MVIHQQHFGRKFYQDQRTGYWISTDYPRIRAHRWVWINIHGKIPKGYHIHHKNENKSDNSIENLELIERTRHLKHHYTEEKREFARKWAANIRPLTKKWHASEEGRAWHKMHALRCNFGNFPFKDYSCLNCNKPFKSRKISSAKFCSNACKSSFRRKSGTDDIEAHCEKCGKRFIKNKYSKQRYCSIGCPKKSHEPL
jgi:hypothetical protein